MDVVLFFLVALLYSSVGHAGASGYLAVLTLALSYLREEARPVALVLNILVASIGTVQFGLAKQIPWRTLLPFAIGSVPLAFYGGSLKLADPLYQKLVGAVLLAAGVRLLLGLPQFTVTARPRDILAVPVGAVIGLLSGLTGTGGGIFLTPLLLFAGWAAPKPAAGVSVAFILVNSLAGLAGRTSKPIVLPENTVHWAIAAAGGGLLGSWFGARRSGFITLRRLLALVLLLAAGKLLVSGRA